MNPRERFIETLTFGTPDKVPFAPGWPRKSTVEAWHAQGLPADANWLETLYREIGVTREATKPSVAPAWTSA